MRAWKYYYVGSYGFWFVVREQDKRRAKGRGVEEFGRGNVKEVREATQDEVGEYIRQMGSQAIEE